MDSSPRSPEQLNTLEALIQLFVNYLHTAKEPDTEGYSWVSPGCYVIYKLPIDSFYSIIFVSCNMHSV